MGLTKGKSILIIAPSLIAESLSLKLTTLDNNLNISLDITNYENQPDLIIWNILNFQSEDLIRLELIKLKEKWSSSKILIIFSGEDIKETLSIPDLNSEGLLINPSSKKVLDSINLIVNGGRVFDLESKPIKNQQKKKLSLNQKILSSGLKQIDHEINLILNYINNESTPNPLKFILRGRLRELITAKSLLIFIWGGSLDIYTGEFFSESFDDNNNQKSQTVYIKSQDSYEIWKLIYKRLITKYNFTNLNLEFNNPSIILSGLKKEYITRLISNILNEMDSLITNLKSNYHEKDIDIEDYDSFLNELKKNTLLHLADSYVRLKKNGESTSLNDYFLNNFTKVDDDFESHNSLIFVDPIIRNEPLNFDGKLLPLYESECFKTLEGIISNWVIRTCNSLASEIFNICSDWPELRTLLINPQLQSTRNFERFRNNINNYNRWQNNIYLPIYLYESKREYLDIIDKKFVKYYKNENRENDLAQLQWFQKQVTLLVEIKDALAPQLEIAVRYVSKIFVTILTKVLGKAIGLIGKGILQGLGRSNSK